MGTVRRIVNDARTMLLFPAASVHGAVESDREWRELPPPPWAAPGPVPAFCALDYESYYDGEYSLDTMSPWDYITHPAFAATLLALVWYDGHGRWRGWVGQPEHAPLRDVVGIEWWSHNAGFDELVHRRLVFLQKLDVPHADEWNCTMDLAAYFQLDRGLDACAPLLIGEQADKSVRAKMKGGMAGAQEQKDYAIRDARQCAWIRFAHGHRWPELERYVSRLQRRAGYRGVAVDTELMTKARAAMIKLMREIERQIPWANRHPVSGGKGIREECFRRGIPHPYSVSLDDPETEVWRKHHDKWGWLEKIRDYVKAKQIVAHIDMMKERTRKDNTVPFELIYRKAPHTARWQSGSGLRMQNLDRDPFNGFHVRHFITHRPRTKLLSCDSSQIEPRVQYWTIGDTKFLDACRKGASPYDAHARATMGWTGGDLKKLSKSDLKCMALYALAKARLLALDYQAAAPQFVEMARTMAGLTVFENERSFSPDMKTFYRESQIKAQILRGECTDWVQFPSGIDAVRDFRRSNPLVTRDWYATEDEMRRHVGGDWMMPLPNGEVIYYFDVSEVPGEFSRPQLQAWVVRQSRNPKNHKFFHGGKLVENRTQRLSREVLADFKYRIDRQLRRFGLIIEWSVHDEINAEAPEREASHLLEAMLEIMHTPPAWAPDLPVAAEGSILECYAK